MYFRSNRYCIVLDDEIDSNKLIEDRINAISYRHVE